MVFYGSCVFAHNSFSISMCMFAWNSISDHLNILHRPLRHPFLHASGPLHILLRSLSFSLSHIVSSRANGRVSSDLSCLDPIKRQGANPNTIMYCTVQQTSSASPDSVRLFSTRYLVVFDVLVVFCDNANTALVHILNCFCFLLTHTQVEVVVDAVTNDKDTKDEVEQRSNGSILAVNVASLVAAPKARGLGRLDGALGQALQCKRLVFAARN